MKILSFALLFFLALPGTLFAHPLDISSSAYTVRDREISAVTYFHTYEAERLLRSHGINLDTGEDYYANGRIFADYVRERATVRNNGKDCRVDNISLVRKEMYEIVSEGLGVEYRFVCDEPVRIITIDLRFFIEYELQTNRLRLYRPQDTWENVAPIAYKVLNPLVHSYTHDLSETQVHKLTDTDGDMIPDEEERIYRTNPTQIDTDGDYYTDYEEVTMGWNPIKKNPSPGQTHRENMPAELIPPPVGIAQNMPADQYGSRFVKQTNLLDTGFGNTRLRDTLKAITEAFKDLSVGSFGYVFALVVLLGFIHAIGPGHSKGFLVSYVLDREKGFLQWLVFVTVFSLVHLADIILLFLVTKLFFSFYDPTEYMVVIQRASLVILFFFSVYIFARAVRKLKTERVKVKDTRGDLPSWERGWLQAGGLEQKMNKELNRGSGTQNLWTGILLAFIAGLAPCSFGWSIFLVLFSMGKTPWVLPLLLALAVGIWLCLFCVLVLTLFFRDRLYAKFRALPTYSSVASSFILIVLSVYLFSLLV